MVTLDSQGQITYVGRSWHYFFQSRKNNRPNMINCQSHDVSNPQKSLMAPPLMYSFIALSYSTAKNTPYNNLKWMSNLIWPHHIGPTIPENVLKCVSWHLGSNFNIHKRGHITHHFEAFNLLSQVDTIFKL